MIDLATNLLGQRVLAVYRDSGYRGSGMTDKLVGVVRAVWFDGHHLRFLIELEGPFQSWHTIPSGEIASWWMDSASKRLVPLPPRGAGTLTWCSHCGLSSGMSCPSASHSVHEDVFSVTIEDP